MPRKRIGELLLERGVVTPAQLEEGLALHRQTRVRLGVALVQKGFLSEEQLAQALALALGVPEVDLRGVNPDWSAVHMLRARFCESNDLFPYALEAHKTRKTLLVAMADPLNLAAVEEIEFTTGVKVGPRVASLSAIRWAILRYYHKVNPDEAEGGRMTVVHRGGSVRVADEGRPARPSGPTASDPAQDEEVIVGEELTPEPSAQRGALDSLMLERARPRRHPTAVDAVAKDLDFLFGEAHEDDASQQMERKFWALLRLLTKKGLLTKEEFLRELGEDA